MRLEKCTKVLCSDTSRTHGSWKTPRGNNLKKNELGIKEQKHEEII